MGNFISYYMNLSFSQQQLYDYIKDTNIDTDTDQETNFVINEYKPKSDSNNKSYPKNENDLRKFNSSFNLNVNLESSRLSNNDIGFLDEILGINSIFSDKKEMSFSTM